MKKQTIFLTLISLSLLHVQNANSQLYPNNAYYDSTGRVFYYAADGNAYYYPEEVQRQYQRNPQTAIVPSATTTQSTNRYQQNANHATSPKNNLLNANWWKTATLKKVKKEIDNGADVNVIGTDHEGKEGSGKLITNVTPLMLAIKYGNPSFKVIETLIEAGADVNIKDDIGETPLILASVYNKNPEIIKLLLNNDADINAVASIKSKETSYKYVITPLLAAAMFNENPEIIELLLKRGANINFRGDNGETALVYAVLQNNNPEIIKILLKHGADINDSNILAVVHKNQNPEVRNLITSEIEKNYKEADYSDRSDFEARVSACILEEEFEQDYHSSLSLEDQFTLGVTSIFSLGLKDTRRTKECQCIFNAVERFLGDAEYQRAREAFNQGRQGTFKKTVKKAIPAAFISCF